MIVDTEICIATVRKEIAECESENYGWSFSDIDESNLSFQVSMKAKDGEDFIVFIKFDDYKHLPLLIDFMDPTTKEVGVKTAYPRDSTSFFHPGKVTICHPCNRKAYRGYTGLHNDWGDPSGWQNNPNVGGLKSLKPILEAIYFRITNDNYNGRMENRKA